MPFFTGATFSKKLSVVPNCGVCKANRSCNHPKQTWPGDSPAKVVFVVDTPGSDTNNAAIGNEFGRLNTMASRVGITLDAYPKIYSAACFGAGPESWKHCQPLVATELARLQPEIIIPFGPKATQSVVGRYWQTPAELYDRWFGQRIPCRELNAWIFPVGNPGAHKRVTEVSSAWEYRWLRDAMRVSGRPWKQIISPQSLVECLYSADEIARRIEHIVATAQVAAFDYEATGLKPEWNVHQIYSMSIAWVEDGDIKCIAFPTTLETHDAIRKFLVSPIRKVAANMKFEERWSHKKLGVRVRNWWWDTMLAAHWEDPNAGVTGLKFQAFARLGVPYFAGEVDTYFESDSNSVRNRINQVPIQSLLTYNGVDSVVELLLASIQMVDNGIIDEHFVPAKYLPANLNTKG
jgi:uracil-DNA glycosylase